MKYRQPVSVHFFVEKAACGSSIFSRKAEEEC